MWAIGWYFLDSVGSKHRIQTVRSLWMAEHSYGVNFKGLISWGSQDICEKNFKRWFKKVYLK